ncbi:hypothetical protein V9T40_014928 [Parthenolecanium corni]|uniref:Major facilitator superfamily (MFS) profile domain-containing protein n=1 Tax=Parthenolecanium corni TaxID=536013 RepID=A0AAN9TLT9_9HEMI
MDRVQKELKREQLEEETKSYASTDGVVYSFGELFKEILKQFNQGPGKTSLIPSILVGTTLCSGPISSALVNRFGCQAVTIAGSIISTICILISIKATCIETLMLTVGLGTGIGFGLIYLPAIVSVTCYFEKYRSVATGIGVCGSGFGTVIFAPLLKWCLVKFGLQGCYVMIACVVLTCVFYGILLRPVPSGETKNNNFCSPENVPLTIISPADDDNLYANKPFENTNGNGISNGARRYSIHGTLDLPQSPNLLGKNTNSQFVSQPSLVMKHPHYKSNTSLKSHHSGIMYKKDIFYTGSIKSINNISKSNGYLHAPQIVSTTPIPPKDDGKKYGCLPCSLECKDTIAEMTDFSLFRDVIFVLFILSNFLTSIGYNLPYLYLPNLLEEKNYPEAWSSYMISTIGAGNTAGRIILGYIADNPAVNRLFIYNICLSICGIACFANAFCSGLVQYLVYAFTFGFTTGAYVGLTSVITVDLLGLDKLTNAFGILLLFQGIASFVGPPIAGYLCEQMGTYDSTFYLAGLSIGLSGAMLFIVPTVQRYLENRKMKKNASPLKC